MHNASNTTLRANVGCMDQPLMRREHTSMLTAKDTHPSHVGTYVMSAAHVLVGAGAANVRVSTFSATGKRWRALIAKPWYAVLAAHECPPSASTARHDVWTSARRARRVQQAPVDCRTYGDSRHGSPECAFPTADGRGSADVLDGSAMHTIHVVKPHGAGTAQRLGPDAHGGRRTASWCVLGHPRAAAQRFFAHVTCLP